MNRILPIVVAGAMAASSAVVKAQDEAPKAAGKAKAASSGAVKSTKEKASYGIGRNIGSQLKSIRDEVDAEMIFRGIKDALSGADSLVSEEELREAMGQFQEEMAEKQAAKAKQLATANQKAGDEFLAANKQKEGVKTLPSGLQYKVIKSGDGATPKGSDKVTVHYRGKLLDGTEFDSSYKRNEPATFGVGQVIPGWTEALQLMKVGDKWQVFIPGKLAYGERGFGDDIPPNSTLTFDIELIDVQK